MLALALLALQSAAAGQQHPIRGLAPGETVQSLAAAASEDEGEFVWMRFLDATSSRPLEGVRVEAWTEPGAKPVPLETLVDDVRSAADGSARVHWRKGEVRGEKLRISRPGYESQQRSPESGELLLLPSQPLRGRVLDLALRPVAGATVRSRQSCAHAISASQTTTAADGSFTLEDFPLSEDEGAELEVFCDGYRARSELEPLLLRQHALERAASTGQGCTILLARAPAWRVRLLDPAGEPLAQRTLRTTERPVIARQTDADGVCMFPAPSESAALYLETCDDGVQLTFSIPRPPRRVLANVRALGADALKSFGEAGLTAVRVHFDLAPRGTEVIPVSIFSESGFVFSGEELEHRVPRGKARVVIGCTDGFYLREEEIEIGAAPRLLEERLGPHCDVTSLRDEDAPDERLIVPGLVDASSAKVRVPWRGEAAPGRVAATSGTVWAADMSSFELAQDPDFELPEGRLYYAEFVAAGAVPLHVFARAGAQAAAPIALVPRAKLTLEGDIARVSSWAGAVEPSERRFVLEPAPGPLFVRVEHRDGTVSRLALVLAPGEQRTLVAD